jgi:hypothetical protein
VTDRLAQRELDVQHRERTAACTEALKQAVDRSLQEEDEPLDVVLVIVEDNDLVGSFWRRHRHEGIPALACRELIEAMRLPAEPLEDAAARKPYHLADGCHAEPCERVA